MKSANLKVGLIVTLVALAGVCLMTLFLVAFLYRDMGQLPAMVRKVGPISLALAAVIFVVTSLSLSRPWAVVRRIDKGEAVPEAERLAALKGFNLLTIIVGIEDAVAFALGPTVQSLVPAILKKSGVDWTLSGLAIVISVAVGLCCIPFQVNLSEIVLAPERRKLNIFGSPDDRKDMGFLFRLLFTALSCVFFAGAALAVAGIGFYREFAGWLEQAVADATSGASWTGVAAYHSAEGGVLLQMGLIVLFILGLSGAAIYLSVANVLSQIKRLSLRMREIAAGASDLGKRARIITFDEVGRLAADFNSVLDGLRRILTEVRELAQAVSISSASLDSFAEAAERSVDEMKGELGSVQASVAEENAIVRHAEEVIGKMGDSIDGIAGEVDAQAVLVQRSSSSVTQMTANIGAVSSSASRAAELSERLSATATEGGKAVFDLAGSVKAIEEASASVGSIIGAISKIAAQTNMLAMNAAIEAAHAGEAGSGFSVVADEVRTLAETSAKSAKEIVSLIRAMDSRIKVGSELSGRAGAAFRDISSLVADSVELIQGIARSMSEQRQGTEEVLSTVTALTDASVKISRMAGEQMVLSAQMGSAMSDIVKASALIDAAIDRQGQTSAELGRTVAKVYKESEANARSTAALGERIAGFKLD